MSEVDHQKLLLQLIASLTLCDHMGDVGNDIAFVLHKMGMNLDWHEPHELGGLLGEMGITTLYGTELTP